MIMAFREIYARTTCKHWCLQCTNTSYISHRRRCRWWHAFHCTNSHTIRDKTDLFGFLIDWAGEVDWHGQTSWSLLIIISTRKRNQSDWRCSRSENFRSHMLVWRERQSLSSQFASTQCTRCRPNGNGNGDGKADENNESICHISYYIVASNSRWHFNASNLWKQICPPIDDAAVLGYEEGVSLSFWSRCSGTRSQNDTNELAESTNWLFARSMKRNKNRVRSDDVAINLVRWLISNRFIVIDDRRCVSSIPYARTHKHSAHIIVCCRCFTKRREKTLEE